MRAGNLTRQVSIYRPTKTLDPVYGSELPGWAPLVPQAGNAALAQRFAAQVVDMLPSRSEAVRQGLAQARDQVRVRIRYRTDVDATMRITIHGDRDQVYQIVGGPAEIGRKAWLEMVCERYTTSGGAS